ncbi:MAG: acyl-CoA thioesterase [Flavobacteriales bacterium]|nr:acyl-CoA thioesterase [Flavobacteriales bacterium]MCB9193434.1 acyl-CoA thioesterase [Flavobacteriales bacterium]
MSDPNKGRPVSESLAETTHLVLPNDTNTLGNLMGGQLLKWLDIACAISAHRHSKRVVVTVAVNHVSFDRPIKLGDFVTIRSQVSRAFSTSMEVWADVWVEDHVSGRKIRCNNAIYTFVAVDNAGSPIEVPEVVPSNEEEQRRYDGALRRRQLRLILAGKMRPEEATELRALFPK